MKKITLLLIATIVSVAFLQAQDAKPLVSKKGTPILPQAGDYAIGINANGVFNIVGNLTKINSGGVYNQPANVFQSPDGVTLFGKYFITDTYAYRGSILVANNTNTNVAFVTDYENWQSEGAANYDPYEHDGKDKQTISNTNLLLNAGKEYRRGYGRLQGFYGYEGVIGFGRSTESYNYNNEIIAANTSPATTNFGSNVFGGTRVLKASSNTYTIGALGVIGVEYFIAPKISLGGQYIWGLVYDLETSTKIKSEAWDAVNAKLEETKAKSANNPRHNWSLNSNAGGGNLFFMFHF